jgi:hypothetical protein
MSATCVAIDTEGVVCQAVYVYQNKFENGR